MKALSEIFNKKVTVYDEWNGNHNQVTVATIGITEDGKEIYFSGKSYWGNMTKVYIPIELADTFMETGRATTYCEIDHCMVGKTWTILN